MRFKIKTSLSTLALVVALFSAATARAEIKIGDKAPALVGKDITGKDIDLSAMQGKTVIVALWATWCEPCKAEMKMLREFYHQHEDAGIEIIALSLDRANDKKAVQKVAAKVDFTVAMASDAKTNGFEDNNTVPQTYVINADGNVSAMFSDQPATEAELAKAITP